MGKPNELQTQTLHFYQTAEYPCSYLPQRRARSLVAAPSHQVTTSQYSHLIQQGFRRSGSFSYKPACTHCQACVPIRVHCPSFALRRSFRRIWRQHQTLKATIRPLNWQTEHFELYRRYQLARHPESAHDSTERTQYLQFLLASYVHSKLIEFRDPKGQLKIVALTDFVEHGLSAVYTFYCPQSPGSLGTYSILWQIQYAQRLGLPWLYLGYWIKESSKMSYKTRFHPFQLYKNHQWVDGDPDRLP